jgi:hypothetical protein
LGVSHQRVQQLLEGREKRSRGASPSYKAAVRSERVYRGGKQAIAKDALTGAKSRRPASKRKRKAS